MANSKKIAIAGTEHTLAPGARAIGPTDPHQLVEVSLILKHRQPLAAPENQDKFINHSDFARTYGADPAHIDKIRQFARENHLQALERGDETLRRTITLTGTAAAMEKAFSVELIEYEHENGTYRGHTGAIHLPEEYASYVSGVFGLDDRPVAKPHFRYRGANRTFGARASNISYTPAQVARLYGFPANADGAGQTIGLIELGGGYRPVDINEYFQGLGLQAPTVKSVAVDHANNRPTTVHSADGEVMLDIEVAGAVAPGVKIAVYFAPNTERGFQDALSTAIHDELNRPSAISISWGSAEINWTSQSIQNFTQVAQEAGLLGITIAAASGDSGSSDGVDDGKNHVDFPASCPYVLAAGGTRLLSANSAITSETAWNDGAQGGATGGGYSTVFARPAWQATDVTQPNRGVPDVSGNADPETGYNILVDGQQMVVGGTSAVAPLWAGLSVLLNQKLNRRVGFVNPSLYSLDESSNFRDVTMGNNGAFAASYGWDPCCGLGSPQGAQLAQAMQHGAPAHAQAHKSERAHAGAVR
ncbi:MAG TPA: S53 family peptidase [Terracidiphilus sp.]|jgi:kumamolisin|nr:S53 family peptidase [Terracidiphilus sp.]